MGVVYDTSQHIDRAGLFAPGRGCPPRDRARFAEYQLGNIAQLVMYGIEPYWHTAEQQLELKRRVHPGAVTPGKVAVRKHEDAPAQSEPAGTVADRRAELAALRDRLTAQAGQTAALWMRGQRRWPRDLAVARWRIIAALVFHPSRPKQAEVGLVCACTQGVVSRALAWKWANDGEVAA